MVADEDLEAVKTRAASIEYHPGVTGSRATEGRSLRDAMSHSVFEGGGVGDAVAAVSVWAGEP